MPVVAPQPLIEDIESGRCLPFVGAGFSLNAQIRDGQRMPDWAGLTRSLAETVPMEPTSGPATAAEFERRFGRVQLIEAIRRRLLVDSAEPGSAHLAFAPLPFDTIYTTNFDLLLEDAFLRIKRPFRSLVGELQMPFHGGPNNVTIVKMHGDLRHEEHIIVTEADYTAYIRKYPIVATHLAAQLITRTALFVGYSLTDPDFQNIRKIVRSRLGKYERMAFVIAFDTPQAEVETRLRDNLHVVSLRSEDGPTHDAVLADFFRDIQTRIDARKGAQLRRDRPDIFEQIPEREIDQALSNRAASPVLSSSSSLCFVALPPGPHADRLYASLIRPTVEELGLAPLRVDEIAPSLLVAEDVRVGIQQARVVIADVSYLNDNVMYELGLAQALSKPIVLLTVDPNDLPFDLAQYRMVNYSMDAPDIARPQLHLALRTVLGRDRLMEIDKLIEIGSLEAAAAVIGMVLEQLLSQLVLREGIAQSSKGSGRIPPGPAALLRSASEAGSISKEENQYLQGIIHLRNAAVHGRFTGTRLDVERAASQLEQFAVHNHLFV